MRFVSEPLAPSGDEYLPCVDPADPPLPARFAWRGRVLAIARVVRTWRSSKTDRGDAYLKRHWFEVELEDGSTAQVYFDRAARRGSDRWWLYAVSSL
ncbi:MAG TPA: DUF6504 family protein [Candidatus Acidoferrales bacterium]|nr:DUF6504 family protein [Candidatus Acidoferrales bacterium]